MKIIIPRLNWMRQQNIYAIGYTNSEFPTTLNAYQTVHGNGLYDIFVSKLSTNGRNLLYLIQH